MAEFALVDEGHGWNNALAHESFQDNVREHGNERALELLREDIRSWIRERRGEQHRWSLTVRDGQMVTDTGVSLQTMTDNISYGPHSDLVPEQIKATAPLEAATLAEATKLAMGGAQRIVFPEHHLNEDGTVVTRFLSVWTRDSSDQTRYHGSRIDLGRNVRIEDVRTGTSFTAFEEKQDVSFHQHREHKHAFALAVHHEGVQPFDVIKQTIITSVHRSHQETYTPDVHRYVFREPVPKENASMQPERETREQREPLTTLWIDVPRAVVHETTNTISDAAMFWRKRQEQREAKDQKIVGEQRVRVQVREEQSDRLTLEKIREKPVRVREVIEQTYAAMKHDAAALGISAETGVAGHGALVLLARIAEKPHPSITAAEKSIKRHEKKELRRKKKEIREAKREAKQDSVKVQLLRSERVESLGTVKERKKEKIHAKARREMKAGNRKEQGRRVKRNKELGINKIAAASEMIPSASKKRERAGRKRWLRRVVRRAERMTEIKQLSKREKKLWVAVARAAKKFTIELTQHRKEAPTKTHQRIERRRKKVREVKAGVVFGWMVWIMLNRANFPPVERKLTMFNGEQKRLDSRIRGNDIDAPTPWVLLSIIWYLTAIREQGTQNTPQVHTTPLRQGFAGQANTTSNQKKKGRFALPRYGIIFALAS